MKKMLGNQLQNNQFKISQKFKTTHKSTSHETWPSMKSERSLNQLQVKIRFATISIWTFALASSPPSSGHPFPPYFQLIFFKQALTLEMDTHLHFTDTLTKAKPYIHTYCVNHTYSSLLPSHLSSVVSTLSFLTL